MLYPGPLRIDWALNTENLTHGVSLVLTLVPVQIVVWEKPRNFERKQNLGEAVVRLDALDLSAHTMTWYKLFPVNSTDLGSTDSLSQW